MSNEDTCALHWEILIIMKFSLGLEPEQGGRGGHGDTGNTSQPCSKFMCDWLQKSPVWFQGSTVAACQSWPYHVLTSPFSS